VASRDTTLGPVTLAPVDSARVSELHLLNASSACVAPAPIETLNVRVGAFGVREPEKLRVSVPGGVGAEGAAATACVASDVASVCPAVFDAVTVTLMAEPTSTVWRTYVGDVAPATGAQAAPKASQRFHWYAKEIGDPDHVPGVAVKVEPA
jgi:hypothetical protein